MHHVEMERRLAVAERTVQFLTRVIESRDAEIVLLITRIRLFEKERHTRKYPATRGIGVSVVS